MMNNSRPQQRTQVTQAKMNRSAQVQQMRALQARMVNGDVAQREEVEEPLQAQVDGKPVQREEMATASEAPKPNNTGLPDNLKSGIESLSGMSMDHVKVHYNSSQPAQLNAHAYAQGSEIHVAPGQEQHVPHEAWHVVQQAQGRVRPTMQMKAGVPVNDDVGLETEADVMGAKALGLGAVQMHAEGNVGTLQRPPSGFPLTRINESPQAPTQLFSAMEASVLIESNYKRRKKWYYEVCMPAMQTIATKSGQTFDDYWGGRSKDDFETAMNELFTSNIDEKSFFDRFSDQPLVDSDHYAGMKRVPKTNILVDSHIAGDDANLQTFVNLYNSGNMNWYRGLSISHFSYEQVRGAGVLASEGTADIPTFTMGNPTPTRWLPGLYDSQLADAVAHSLAGSDAGLTEIATRKSVPIGVTVQYPITAPNPIAYLNDGEQVVRGPITGATVFRLILLGPGGYSYKLAGGATTDLPPAAPYQAAVGSPDIVAWEAQIDQWLLAHP
ncbi:MAG: DUF4157 domain-containing protein [Burkholderiales bacterium]|nr:DUF4157 domain-containing protein [Burkholderiales bacterium]